MSSKKALESQPSMPDVGVLQPILLSPAPDPVVIVPIQKSRKRKHTEVDDRNRLKDPFCIQAHPSFPSSNALHLTPRLLIPRSFLPLAYLDQIGGYKDGPGSMLFSARIEVLESKHQEDRQAQPMVLIAQSTGDGRLQAIERVQGGIYALCRLGSGVTLRALERLPALGWNSSTLRERPHVKQDEQPDREWWRAAMIASEHRTIAGLSTSSPNGKTPNVRLCLRSPVQNGVPQRMAAREEVSALPKPIPIETTLTNMVEEASKGPEEVLNMIKSQYLEALYASKTSLAYFAKGPLSRARATFHGCDASTYDRAKLVQYLRSNILSLPTMDIKYHETLPSLVKDLPFGALSDDEGASMIASIGEKARKSKRTRVGKNGLYAGEDLKATQWWLGRDISHMGRDSTDTREDAIRTTLLEQKARETQLQIILAFETLALEASAIDSTFSSAPADLPEAEVDSDKKPKKRTKPQDLTTLVEILADRLCIWQSMSIDAAKMSSNENKSDTQRGAKMTIGVAGNDYLRQFCVDVVLPFYGARLADLTAVLCQKLGGPKQLSPKRPPLAKVLTSSASIKPGSVVQRQQPRKPRRTLERVLTDERSATQRPPPSLSRSATDSMLPRMKREESDISLSSIPLNRVAMHKRYSQREVDLNAASQATEAKLKRKAKVDQELQGAIAALKRPNPRMAVKELVEDAERRIAGSRSRKSRNPVRNPLAQGVQIMATPNKSRHHDFLADDLRFSRPRPASPAAIMHEVPPSSVSRISDSARKAHGSSSFCKDGTQRIGSNVLPTIEQTPTKGPAKLLGRPMSSSTTMTADEDRGHLTPRATELEPPDANPASFLSYSLPSWPSKVQETPSKGRTADYKFLREKHNVGATPSKHVLTSKDSTDTSAAAALSSSQEQETSIYASLGWDDDADELLG